MDVDIRPPCLNDGAAISRLVKESRTLDVNSSYLYFLLAEHFSNTCAVAQVDNELVGFVTAYFLPSDPSVLFVWQIAVAPSVRGKGLALAMLKNLAKRDWFPQIKEIQCTISPSNQASNQLFAKFAEHLSASVEVSPFLTAEHLGQDHEDEPLVRIKL